MDWANSGDMDWAEQVLNAAAGQAIRQLFTKSESVDVKIGFQRSTQILAGNIDSLSMKGRGLVIRKDFPIEELWFETDAVSLDFSAVPQGKIRLKQPTRAVAKVTLSEAGVNQALKAALVQKRLNNVALPDGLPDGLPNGLPDGDRLSFTDLEIQLLGSDRVRIFAKARSGNGAIVPICAISNLKVQRRRQLVFEEVSCEKAVVPEELQHISEVLSYNLVRALNSIVDVDRFNLDGVQLWLNRVEIQNKQLIFGGYAEIQRFPRSG